MPVIDIPVVSEVEPLGPQSLAWELLGDWRLFAMLGRGLLLQVGHPVVAAGVEQHSSNKTQPYARLERSLQSRYQPRARRAWHRVASPPTTVAFRATNCVTPAP